MAARPPSNDIDDEPDSLEFGIAALDARIEGREVSFPATAAELEASHGDVSVPVGPGAHEMALSKALARCDREEFASKQELLDALHPVFEAERESSGLLSRLRALAPF